MIFNSLVYLILLFLVVILYWNFSSKARLLLIFFSSLLFYSFWRIEFVFLLLFSVTVDWLIANKIYSCKENLRRKYLFCSIFINLGLLFYFKYLLFFSNNAIGLMNLIGMNINPIALNIILPLGISFYTFQTISYVVDVYRKHILPEKNFLLYACYVTFFPQLIAGPILRASEVINQFKFKKKFSHSFIINGIRRLVYGFFLKVVLADGISPLVDNGFSQSPEFLTALDIWTLAFLFGFQIYFDFSGYSHIAKGSAQMIGINFPENFNFPYFSSSPKDFWRRWHISLSSWIRDYLYSPLTQTKALNVSKGGLNNEVSSSRTLALFITWSIMGFWHGANWTFLIWGLYHAFFIVIYRITLLIKFRIPNIIKNQFGFLVTLPIIMLSWIPFRANSLSDSLMMWSKVFSLNSYFAFGLRENTYLITFLILIGMIITYQLRDHIFQKSTKNKKLLFIFDSLFICTLFSFVLIYFQSIDQFIYFQF